MSDDPADALRLLVAAAGLELADAEVYVALLAEGSASVDEIAAVVAVAAGHVSAALERLTSAGFVARNTAAGRYAALPPEVGVVLAVAEEERQLHDRLAELARVRATAPKIAGRLQQDPDSSAGVTRPLRGETAMRTAFARTASSAREMVRVQEPDGSVDAAVLEAARASVALLCRTDAAENVLAAAAVTPPSPESGPIEVRVLPRLPGRMLIADSALAVIDISRTGGDVEALVVDRSPLLDTLVGLWEAQWSRAVRIDDAATDLTDAGWRIAPEDHRLLALLAAGLKDEAIARRLAIGLRTVVRRVGVLARDLDAETRFQMGVQASRRGLL